MNAKSPISFLYFMGLSQTKLVYDFILPYVCYICRFLYLYNLNTRIIFCLECMLGEFPLWQFPIPCWYWLECPLVCCFFLQVTTIFFSHRIIRSQHQHPMFLGTAGNKFHSHIKRSVLVAMCRY